MVKIVREPIISPVVSATISEDDGSQKRITAQKSQGGKDFVVFAASDRPEGTAMNHRIHVTRFELKEFAQSLLELADQ